MAKRSRKDVGRRGWYNESVRHRQAARGIKTAARGICTVKKKTDIDRTHWQKLDRWWVKRDLLNMYVDLVATVHRMVIKAPSLALVWGPEYTLEMEWERQSLHRELMESSGLEEDSEEWNELQMELSKYLDDVIPE